MNEITRIMGDIEAADATAVIVYCRWYSTNYVDWRRNNFRMKSQGSHSMPRLLFMKPVSSFWVNKNLKPAAIFLVLPLKPCAEFLVDRARAWQPVGGQLGIYTGDGRVHLWQPGQPQPTISFIVDPTNQYPEYADFLILLSAPMEKN